MISLGFGVRGIHVAIVIKQERLVDMTKQAKLTALVGYYKSKGFEFSWNDVETLQNCAAHMQRLATRLCNGVIDQTKYDQSKELVSTKLKHHIHNNSVAFKFEFGGDPRGFCLKIFNSKGEQINPNYFN